MDLELPRSLALRLERCLSHGAGEATRERALIIRRARGFALIGLVVVSLAVVSVWLTGSPPEIVVGGVMMTLFILFGLAIGFVQQARFIVPMTHLGMGAMLIGIVGIAMREGTANEISATFPVLLVLVTSYVLGNKAACFWTVACIVGVAIAVAGVDAAPHRIDGPPVSLVGLFATRSLVVLGALGLATAERRFADRQSRELEYLVRHDTLTGLFNRRAFEERLGDAVLRATRHRRRIAVIAIDLDGFKSVNDRYGHAVGDVLLRVVGQRIGELTRAIDTASRMGGDEFLLLLEEIQEDKDIRRFAERLISSIKQPVDVGGELISVGASAGIATFPAAGRTAEAIDRAADLAMYASKAAGGDCIRMHTDAPVEDGLLRPATRRHPAAGD